MKYCTEQNMITQQNITVNTPMGANLVPSGGATFRVWAPRAAAVYLNGVFGGVTLDGHSDPSLLLTNTGGYWTGFVALAQERDLYKFWIEGAGSYGFKRDPYARELATDAEFPDSSSIIRSASAYPWHDSSFVTPDFSDMIVYQLHIGTYTLETPGNSSTFLDVVGKIPYLVSLGVNVLQPLPVDEVEVEPSLGYNGADLFSPDFPYIVTDEAALENYLVTVNQLLVQKGCRKLQMSDIRSGYAQLKVLVDLCHLYGLAVVFDIVYNHAGGFTVNNQLDDECLYYFDRVHNVSNNNDSLYFTDQDRGTGGLSFALWNNDVRQFVINNARYYIEEFHVDGFRYDEISSLLSMNKDSGWTFCQALTGTVRVTKPRILQNAEYWPTEWADYPRSRESIVSAPSDGAGFDVMQHDGVRTAVRGAVQSASFPGTGPLDFDGIANSLHPDGLPHGWQAVTCIENHDIVKTGQENRVPTLADSSNHRSWYASSRTRFAMGILLTAPGIPQLFMGQEFLEDKQWTWDSHYPNLLYWAGLNSGSDEKMVDHLRFTQDLIRLRWNQPALRSDNVSTFHVHNQNRVIAYHRWLDSGSDVIVVATLSNSTWWGYSIGFPYPGRWVEAFNSDVYENWVNPMTAGNGGGVDASGPPMHGFGTSASVVIPANGFVVFTRG
jgi:1,4-alpha-glucan branching enzyme